MNRDITNLSKKLIFQLHRIAQDENSDEGRNKAIQRSSNKFAEVQKLHAKVKEEVEGERSWRYARNMYITYLLSSLSLYTNTLPVYRSGGLQELIEALSLRHYLLQGKMISRSQVQLFLTSEAGDKVGTIGLFSWILLRGFIKYLDLSSSDYLLGISDLTGELMRLAISTITRSGGRDRAFHTAAFVRRCLAGTAGLFPLQTGPKFPGV
jgi:predicted translin family RNA/ssDNA-binding protein